MKTNIFALAGLALAAMLPLTTACKPKPAPEAEASSALIHAIYAVENEWQSPDDVAVPELDAFDFVYVMAAPDWQIEDFDMTKDEVIAKYVTNHQYKHPEGIKALIDGVHSQGGRILCSFPGTAFNHIAENPDRADKFAAMMAAFISKYGYDGVEVDWEHTLTEESHIDFMKRIRRELSAIEKDNHYWLTTALNSNHHYTPETAGELSSNVDWINVMYYDMGGGIWEEVPTHNAPLNAMDSVHRANWSLFAPEKIHIGIPNYGFYYKGIKPGEKVAEGKTLKDYGRYCNATELPALLAQGWTEKWDDTAKCPYYISPDSSEFMTLESPRSLDEKLEWIKENKFGGIFWWEYSCDWEKPAKTGERGKHLLTDHITAQIR